ncbi:sialidase family protein [Lentimicrobium sp.]|uniref:sialidase family protein n=1 Tax=Lentimicrobium sp. TaxID=2034841 RepID=UPI002BB7BCE0|nr:sialidase family protein [Lentimicrobium sp.]HPR26960.1 sialidase family protein [Lentimicrobium sp.]
MENNKDGTGKLTGDAVLPTDGTVSVKAVYKKVPLFINRCNPGIITLEVNNSVAENSLKSVKINFSRGSQVHIIDSVLVYIQGTGKDEAAARKLFAITGKATKSLIPLAGEKPSGNSSIYHFGFILKDGIRLEQSFGIESVDLTYSVTGKMRIPSGTAFRYRPALVLRGAGQDHVHTYRIPGLITTNAGTLIAIYDIRHNNSKDLQEDIDIGMSRSTDGGQTWEPMNVITDMGAWGGRPDRLNGTGDPCILYDHFTGTLWVAALWMSGSHHEKMLWWDSKPGMTPEETGQFILTKSTDDGISWSDPVNITSQIKDPSWQLLLAGPGRGLTLSDGTLVFPAQYKSDLGVKALDGGQYTCQSTIVYSTDKGKTWQIGKGAKPNTTEAQAVELSDGSIMLNMRDDLNRTVKDKGNGRAVAISRDLGKNWTLHPSSNHALTEPNCMASLIPANVKTGRKTIPVLFFSNPSHASERKNMTIKASADEGNTWPPENQILLNEETGFGYSCLTITKDKCVGILYEGDRELFFQKIPVTELNIK